MNTFYCKHYDFENWKDVQNDLIKYYHSINPTDSWFPVSIEEIQQGMPNILEKLTSVGILPLQVIFFSFPGPTRLDSKDPDSPHTIYTHVDRVDNEHCAQSARVVTNFSPEYVLNIPLINCEKSTTFFYEIIDKSQPELLWGGWGEQAKKNKLTIIPQDNLKTVDQVTLTCPAFLRISKPHGVHNPTNNPRIVASIRINSDSPALKKLLYNET